MIISLCSFMCVISSMLFIDKMLKYKILEMFKLWIDKSVDIWIFWVELWLISSVIIVFEIQHLIYIICIIKLYNNLLCMCVVCLSIYIYIYYIRFVIYIYSIYIYIYIYIYIDRYRYDKSVKYFFLYFFSMPVNCTYIIYRPFNLLIFGINYG